MPGDAEFRPFSAAPLNRSRGVPEIDIKQFGADILGDLFEKRFFTVEHELFYLMARANFRLVGQVGR